jgi:hypothetical protein
VKRREEGRGGMRARWVYPVREEVEEEEGRRRRPEKVKDI